MTTARVFLTSRLDNEPELFETPDNAGHRAGMQVLDVMVAAGGLSEFAAGNDAVLIRGRGDHEKVYGLRLADLLDKGDTSANSVVLPGDVILVPKSFF